MPLIRSLLAAPLDTLRQILRTLIEPPVPSPVPLQQQRLAFTAEIVRADDLLVMTLEAYNLALDETTQQLRADGPGDAFIAVRLPPQHIVEETFADGGTDDAVTAPPISARLAGDSRLVFHVAPALLPLAWSVDAILTALGRSAPLVRDRTGAPPPAPGVGRPGWFGGLASQVTAIEAPWRLVLSPHPHTRWAHAAAPVRDAAGDAVELWHTRLGVADSANGPVDETARQRRRVRAVHSPDFGRNAPSDTSPFPASLSRKDRRELVRLSSERSLRGHASVAVDQLILSALGAHLQLDGQWNAPGIDLVRWQHGATLGRDHHVKTVRRGYLFPCGHRAALFKVTERKLAPAPGRWSASAFSHTHQTVHEGGGPQAYLRTRRFIVVEQPVRTYGHRHVPFTRWAFRTLVTPPLADSEMLGPGSEADEAGAFWPRYERDGVEQDVVFEVEATDREGRTSQFGVRQLFVFASTGADALAPIIDAYNGIAGPVPAVPEQRRRSDLDLQRVAYALVREPGDTALDTASILLGALRATGSPPFLPALASAEVIVPAVREITGADGASTIRYDPHYLVAPPSEFGNSGEVFARFDGARADLAFPVQKVGGLVAPDLTPQGLSRRFGPVGDVEAFAAGTFNPAAIFQGVNLLGGIPLGEIIAGFEFEWPEQAGLSVPGLTSVRKQRDLGDGRGPVPVVETHYLWETGALVKQSIFEPDPGARFVLDAMLVTPQQGGTPLFEVNGALEKFQITIPPDHALIAARFDHVRFSAGSGRKLDVSLQFAGLEFRGALAFVETLRTYIPLDGFIDPPYLDVDTDGVRAGYSLGLPTVGIGIFVLQDISVAAGFHLPFAGGAAGLRFAFCERDQPFLLTVMAFGGGGFFALELTTGEVTNVEAALEFGAAVAINLGVAAGKASITGGVYYKRSQGGAFVLSAYFRAAGELSVLGIISVSVELYVGLTFLSKVDGGQSALTGTATVTVKIRIAFFSKTVSIGIERRFAGSDPSFAEMVPVPQWAEYCAAFAPEPV